MFYATIFVWSGGRLACVHLKQFWKNAQETENSDYFELSQVVRTGQIKDWSGGKLGAVYFLYFLVLKSYDCMIFSKLKWVLKN